MEHMMLRQYPGGAADGCLDANHACTLACPAAEQALSSSKRADTELLFKWPQE